MWSATAEATELLLTSSVGTVGLCSLAAAVYGEGRVAPGSEVDLVWVNVRSCHADGYGCLVMWHLVNLNGLLEGSMGPISGDGCAITSTFYFECAPWWS